jgi:hypothetical protein
MKTGRNDPCPCGSGKKFKKCCLGKSLLNAPPSQDARAVLAAASAPLKQTPARRQPAAPEKRAPEQPPRPRNPLQQKWDALWTEFKSQHGEAREAIFLRTLDDNELMDDEAAFEMLNGLHEDAVVRGERERFGRMVETLAERRPELYQQSSHYFLSWQLLDALADCRPDVLSLTRALAGKAGRDIDIVNRGLDALAYHGQLVPLVEARRIGWPLVRESNNIMGWGIGEFSEAGASCEMYAYLEVASSPDPSNGELLERIRYFVEDPRLEYVAEFIGDVSGNVDGAWTVADFSLRPPKNQRRRGEWDDEDDEENETPEDRGSRNLFRLITQFVGYLRRVEQVPYPRGEFIRHALHGYFIERHRGDLNPRLSMLDQALHPKKKLPPPPKPSHPLCPERVTFEICLAQRFGFMAAQHHKAAALFEVIPAWLRFLQSKKLIDDEQRARTLEELRPLHASVLKVMENYTEDPTVYRSLKGWPDVP